MRVRKKTFRHSSSNVPCTYNHSYIQPIRRTTIQEFANGTFPLAWRKRGRRSLMEATRMISTRSSQLSLPLTLPFIGRNPLSILSLTPSMRFPFSFGRKRRESFYRSKPIVRNEGSPWGGVSSRIDLTADV